MGYSTWGHKEQNMTEATQHEDLHFLELTHTHTKKDVLFIIGDWNAKVQSQEIP